MKSKLNLTRIAPESVPIALLLEADPSRERISRYIKGSLCFAAYMDDDLVGVCIVNNNETGKAEIYNIAVSPELQQKGIGSQLLNFVISEMRAKGDKSLCLGTGTFGHQLTFYQRLGFRPYRIIRDFFVNNYPEPVYENGLRHRDMLLFELELEE